MLKTKDRERKVISFVSSIQKDVDNIKKDMENGWKIVMLVPYYNEDNNYNENSNRFVGIMEKSIANDHDQNNKLLLMNPRKKIKII